MHDPARLLLAALAIGLGLLGLACGGLLGPTVKQVELEDDGCGAVSVRVRSTGSGTLVASAGGRERARWAVSGPTDHVAVIDVEEDVVAVEVGELGGTLHAHPRVAGLPEVFIGPARASVGVPVLVQLPSTCSARPGVAVRATVDGHPIPEQALLPGQSEVPLPELALGTHQVTVEVFARGVVVRKVDATVERIATPRVAGNEGGADADGDGYAAVADGGDDCDDANPSIRPGMDEIVDGIDQNCDGRIDEGTEAFDDDGDGLSELQGDCDDEDPGVRPGKAELPDCRDQDCDGEIDEGVKRPARDDALEPNDRRDQATDLKTAGRRSFTRTLRLVTRDEADQEWITFYSDDGPFDLWGITVTAVSLGDESAYEVVIHRDGHGVRRSGTLGRTSRSVHVLGTPLSSDTGMFTVQVKPTRVPLPWCPLELRIRSG